MARYDVYPDPDGYGYLLDVQSDLLDGFDTRVMVPLLLPTPARKPVRRLNPTFHLAGQPLVMYSELLVTMPCSVFSHPIGNLHHHHDEIVAALDMVFQGF